MLRDGSYGLVVLDPMLPKVNGFAVSEAIQALPVKPRVTVLAAISRYFAGDDRRPTCKDGSVNVSSGIQR